MEIFYIKLIKIMYCKFFCKDCVKFKYVFCLICKVNKENDI